MVLAALVAHRTGKDHDGDANPSDGCCFCDQGTEKHDLGNANVIATFPSPVLLGWHHRRKEEPVRISPFHS
ncbi:mCG1050905 [Mus musculus]|nr:mCG1050905 [Mus musculus]